MRNANKEASTALRKKARTTKTSVPSTIESIMDEIGGLGSKPLIPEVCTTCGNYDPTEDTRMMLPGTDIFVVIPFHAAHTILERGALTYSIVGVLTFHFISYICTLDSTSHLPPSSFSLCFFCLAFLANKQSSS